MLLYILLAIAALVLIVLVVIATRPNQFRVTRSLAMNAPAAKVFAQVNDFHLWKNWSPWAKLDPNMKETYDGPASGTGAKYHWVGNKQVGEGRMTITQVQTDQRIEIKLEFIKPFATTNTTEFTFAPQGSQTLVTWTMSGSHTFMSKAFCLLMDMDKMIGKDFEKGLAAMKAVAESA